MSALNYDETVVLILFAQGVGNPQPTPNDITQFDAGLRTAFEPTLQQILPAEGLPTDVQTKSLALGCRPNMPGNTAAAQIRNACGFIKSAQTVAPAGLAAVASGLVSSAAKRRSKPAARRGKRKRQDRPRGQKHRQRSKKQARH